jgi:hypothetical protein
VRSRLAINPASQTFYRIGAPPGGGRFKPAALVLMWRDPSDDVLMVAVLVLTAIILVLGTLWITHSP